MDHRTRMEWERNVMQKSINQLTRDLEKEVNWLILILKQYEFQNQRGNHLEDCIKGEEGMISLLKKLIAEVEIRHAIDVARILENAQVAK
ncbi:unnamed protein product [Caenorhabditis nigoni]